MFSTPPTSPNPSPAHGPKTSGTRKSSIQGFALDHGQKYGAVHQGEDIPQEVEVNILSTATDDAPVRIIKTSSRI